MSKLVWDVERSYETGVDRGTFFPLSGPGEVWNGLISIDESVEELRDRIRYQDGVKTLNQRRPGSYSATIKALSLPSSFNHRQEFGFSFRTKAVTGYKTHIVYNAMGSPPKAAYEYEKVSTFDFDISTRPVAVTGAAPTAHVIIDTSLATSTAVTAFEDIVYGSDSSDPRLPLPDEIITTFESTRLIMVIDHGDGTFTVVGPDELVSLIDPTTFQVTSPTAIYLDDDTYTLSSY